MQFVKKCYTERCIENARMSKCRTQAQGNLSAQIPTKQDQYNTYV